MGALRRLGRKQRLAGGAVISRMLATEGVDSVFGIIDGTYLGMYAAFEGDGIRLVSPRHETSGVHMAGAYARLTGKLGVVMASNGPGVANALPGVAVEEAEGNRVLLLTTSRRHGIVHPDRGGTFQCFPQVQTIGAMAKWSCAVPSADRIAELLRRALRACYTGRPGVVHLEVPEDVMNGTVEADPSWFRPVAQYRLTEPLAPGAGQVRSALELLAQAKRPLLHVGSGVLHAGCWEAVQRLAAVHEAVLTTSWAARAALDERDPRVVPMWAVDAVTRARREADLVLVLGSRLGETDFWGKAPYWARPEDQKLIQVDLDLEHLGNNRPVDLAVQGDVGAFVDALLACPAKGDREGRRRWIAALGEQHAHASGPHSRGLRRGTGRRRHRRHRRRQHLDLGPLLPRGPLPQRHRRHAQDGHARRRRGPGHRRQGRLPRPAGGLPHRRRRLRLPSPGGRDRGARRPAGDLDRVLRSAVGDGQDQPALRAASHQDPGAQDAASRAVHPHRPGRDPLRRSGSQPGGPRRAGLGSPGVARRAAAGAPVGPRASRR